MNTLFGEEYVFEKVEIGATFSECRKHRFALWRIWDENKPLAMFIGLNPSTADDKENDNTIDSVDRLSRFNGYGGFYMMNCWSFISTDPDLLPNDLSGKEENYNRLREIANKCKDVVFAWGNFRIVVDHKRDKDLMEMFPDALCITKNKNGSPGHPLYKKGTIKFTKYKS